VTTPGLGAELKARHPGLLDQKIRVIYNGYDEANFSGLPAAERAERFELVHAGLMTPEFRDPFPILAELAALIAAGQIGREETQVTFLGSGPWAHSEDFAARVRSVGLEGVVRIENRIPHGEALLRQARAAALLLLQASDDTRQLIPAKAFEYLRLGRPILALTLDGATADLLRDQDQCHVHGPTDAVGLRRSLIELHRFWRESRNGSSLVRSVDAYERSRLAGQLAGVLDELVPAASAK
jgi:glycosyltransferase involved in cell wall biosynthesis